MKHSEFFIFLFIFSILGSLLIVEQANAQQVVNHYVETDFDCTVSIPAVIGANITDAVDFDFVNGSDYLLFAHSAWSGSNSNDEVGIRVLHNDTEFEGSYMIAEPALAGTASCTSNNRGYTYFWFDVWSPNATEADDDIVMEFEGLSGGSVTFGNTFMAVIELENKLVNGTTYFHVSNETDATLSTTWTNVNDTSVTFTPPEADLDWLVLGLAQYDTGTATVNFQTRLNHNGTDLEPNFSQEGEETGSEIIHHTLSRVYEDLPMTPQTFSIQSRTDDTPSGTNERINSAIFIMAMDIFTDHTSLYNSTDVDITTDGDYHQQLDTLSITPTNNNQTLFILSDFGTNNTNNQIEIRVQLNDVDQPANQTDNSSDFNEQWDSTDRLRYNRMTATNVTNSTQTVDIDVSEVSGGDTGLLAQQRSLVLWIAEFASIDFTRNQTDSINFTDPSTIIQGAGNYTLGFNRNQTSSMNFTDPNTITQGIGNYTLAFVRNILNDLNFLDVHTQFFDEFEAVINVTATGTVTGGGGGFVGGGDATPTVPDSDQDGFVDTEDACPLEAEDFNNFQDDDGCPDQLLPPEPITIFDLGFPFGFNELSVVDDWINLETDSAQPQAEDLGIRWLGDEPITITKITTGSSPFEIQFEDLPVSFGNNQFGYTQSQIFYTVQEPDVTCGATFSFNCLDEVTYKIPVIVTGEVRGKSVIADGTLTIDNSNRFNPYWLVLLFLIAIPIIAFLYWRRNRRKKRKVKDQITEAPTKTTITIKPDKTQPQKTGTTRRLLTESEKTNILGQTTKKK